MKKTNVSLTVLLVCGAVFAAQDSTLTERELRDPKKLEPWLEANAADAESRLAAIEGGTATVTLPTDCLIVGNDDSNETAMIVVGDVTLSQDGATATMAIASDIIINADINTSAAIARSKLAAGTADHVVINAPATGAFSSEAQLAVTRGGTAKSTLTTNALLLGMGTAPIGVVAVGTDNQVLLGNTSAAPSFGALTDACVPDSITVSNYYTKSESAAAYATAAQGVSATNAETKVTTGADPGHTHTAYQTADADLTSLAAGNGASLASNVTATALSADIVGTNEMADADHGDVSWSSGVATVDNVVAENISGNIAAAQLTNAVTGLAGAETTNDVLVAGGGTNRYIFVTFGDKLVVKSISGL
ncbi:MAG: hypothetical protein PHH26_01660 [Candidatus Thermoplasmatota archaeon]|nr:hypothetical protein [Candidatus Thermoplasmatota archaeon]